MTNLDDIKVGDYLTDYKHSSLMEVVKVTKTQVHTYVNGVVIEKWRKRDGEKMGCHGFNTRWAHKATPEEIKEIKRNSRFRELQHFIDIFKGDITDELFEAIEKVAEIMEKEKIK